MMTKDIRTIAALLALMMLVSGYAFYQYELFYGSWCKSDVKSVYYAITAIILLYLTFDDLIGKCDRKCYELKSIAKICLSLNFLLFAAALQDFVPKHRFYIFFIDGSILATSIMVFITGFRHGYFDNE